MGVYFLLIKDQLAVTVHQRLGLPQPGNWRPGLTRYCTHRNKLHSREAVVGQVWRYNAPATTLD